MSSSHVKRLVYAALFVALMCISAGATTIPLYPVPITLQTFFVMLSGAVLGPYFGVLSMIVYLVLGFIGLPVFSKYQSGLGVLFGPTGGYLVGFVLCALVVGLMVKMRKNPGLLWYGMAMAAGTLIIYACGMLQLSVVMHMPLDKAFVAGVLWFIPLDILKITVASVVAYVFNKRGEGRR